MNCDELIAKGEAAARERDLKLLEKSRRLEQSAMLYAKGRGWDATVVDVKPHSDKVNLIVCDVGVVYKIAYHSDSPSPAERTVVQLNGHWSETCTDEMLAVLIKLARKRRQSIWHKRSKYTQAGFTFEYPNRNR